MDDYREKLIELVRERPLLWDPRVPDYKDKDQRAEVWKDFSKMLTAPKGTTHKDTWGSLIRCHCNALQRAKKKSGSGADKSKPWKFLKQMEFLIAIKGTRDPSGNLPEAGDEESETEADTFQAVMEEANIMVESDEVNVPEQVMAVAEKSKRGDQGGPKHKKSNVEFNFFRLGQMMHPTKDPILSLMETKLKREPDSPRMGFFKSIMPRVEALEEDLFQEFQLQTLQLLKNLHASKTQQQPSAVPAMTSPSPLSSATTSPSSSSYPPTALHHSQGQTPQSHWSGQSYIPPLQGRSPSGHQNSPRLSLT